MSAVNPTFNEAQPEKTESAMRKSTCYELIFAVMFTGFLVWAGFYLLDPATLPIKQVRIEGEFRHLSTSALQDLIRPGVTGGFFNIDVSAVRDTLLTEPWVRDVSVHRVWPDRLQVFVTEQVAVARWKDTGLLNRSSRLFTPARSAIPAGLPLLDGPEGSQAMMMEKYFYLQTQLEPLGIQVAVLRLDERRAWMFETTDGLLVVIGRKDFDERIARFVELIPGNLGEKLRETEMIDMRYPNGFAVRWKKGSTEIMPESGVL
jgi:cell division protein FtsQ